MNKNKKQNILGKKELKLSLEMKENLKKRKAQLKARKNLKK
tara:strand:+ start:2288 stop:2410 length:123 start_codon:yes stop_codon:yes gene_type:complete